MYDFDFDNGRHPQRNGRGKNIYIWAFGPNSIGPEGCFNIFPTVWNPHQADISPEQNFPVVSQVSQTIEHIFCSC
jgi:hypothetical protein